MMASTRFILPLWPLEGYLTPVHTYFLKGLGYGIHDVILEALVLVLNNPGYYTEAQLQATWNPAGLRAQYTQKQADIGTRWTLEETEQLYLKVLTAIYSQLYSYLRYAVQPIYRTANLGNAMVTGVRYYHDSVEMTLDAEYLSF